MPARSPQSRRTPSRDQDPPLVAEVRAIRRKMLREAGGDIGKLMEMARREVERRAAGRASVSKKRSRRAA